MVDKEIERNRYNLFSKNKIGNLELLGAKNFSQYLQGPFIRYEEIITNLLDNNKTIKQLDLCCGDGIHSFIGAKYGADVTAIDYAENSILIARRRAEEVGMNVKFLCCDVEELPFSNESFDLITCIGSLSYVDHVIFINEVKRVLKSNGRFIVIDSFNHNFIFKINRYIHYLRGGRSKSTLDRMPDMNLLKLVESNFKHLEVEYFGIFVFIAPLFSLILSPIQVNKIIKRLDLIFCKFRRFSFKILFVAVK